MMAICTGGGGSDLDVLMVMLEKATKALVIVKPMIFDCDEDGEQSVEITKR